MPDYSKSIIYKVNGGGLVYFGSTTQTLQKRLSIHKNDKKNGKNLSINQILDCDDYSIEILENYPCNNKEELLQRETYWIDNNECINIRKPFVSIEDKKLNKKLYQQTHKDMCSKSTAKWEEKNKEKRKAYLKEWYLKNKQKISPS